MVMMRRVPVRSALMQQQWLPWSAAGTRCVWAAVRSCASCITSSQGCAPTAGMSHSQSCGLVFVTCVAKPFRLNCWHACFMLWAAITADSGDVGWPFMAAPSRPAPHRQASSCWLGRHTHGFHAPNHASFSDCLSCCDCCCLLLLHQANHLWLLQGNSRLHTLSESSTCCMRMHHSTLVCMS